MSELADIDELLLMTNLYPATTGLPMTIWVGPSYNAPHDARIKVSQAHGPRMDPRNLAVVALRPAPHVVAGHLSSADLRAVTEWLALNEAAVLEHWDGLTDGVQLGRQLRPLSPPISMMPRIAAVAPGGKPFTLRVRWEKRDAESLVDVSGMIESFKVYAPLRGSPELFGKVRVGEWGADVVWTDEIDMSADTLWRLAQEQSKP